MMQFFIICTRRFFSIKQLFRAPARRKQYHFNISKREYTTFKRICSHSKNSVDIAQKIKGNVSIAAIGRVIPLIVEFPEIKNVCE